MPVAPSQEANRERFKALLTRPDGQPVPDDIAQALLSGQPLVNPMANLGEVLLADDRRPSLSARSPATSDVVGRVLAAAGADPRLASRLGHKIAAPLTLGAELGPGTGEALSALEARESGQRAKNAFVLGNIGEALKEGGLTALNVAGAVPGLGIAPRALKKAGKAASEAVAPAFRGAENVLQAASRDIPVDPVSRDVRATQQGFDIEGLHFTKADFDEFDLGKVGSARDAGFYGRGVYFGPRDKMVSGASASFTGGAKKAVDARIRMRKPFEIRVGAGNAAPWGELAEHGWPHAQPPFLVASKVEQAHKPPSGLAASIGLPPQSVDSGIPDLRKPGESFEQLRTRLSEEFTDAAKAAGFDGVLVREAGNDEIMEIVSFDLKNIRSRHDAFHPDAADKAGLLASKDVVSRK